MFVEFAPAPFGVAALRRATLGLNLQHSANWASRWQIAARGDDRFFDGTFSMGFGARVAPFLHSAFNVQSSLFLLRGAASNWRHSLGPAFLLDLGANLAFTWQHTFILSAQPSGYWSARPQLLVRITDATNTQLNLQLGLQLQEHKSPGLNIALSFADLEATEDSSWRTALGFTTQPLSVQGHLELKLKDFSLRSRAQFVLDLGMRLQMQLALAY